MTQDHEATAKRILPCGCHEVDEWKNGDIHNRYCAASFRPAVAAALAERDAEVERLKTLLHDHTVSSTNEYAQLRAAIDIRNEREDQLRDEREDLLTEINWLRKQNQEIQAKLAEVEREVKEAEHNLNNQVRLNAREYARGLERVKEISTPHGIKRAASNHYRLDFICGLIIDAIDAEIAKAGKEKRGTD